MSKRKLGDLFIAVKDGEIVDLTENNIITKVNMDVVDVSSDYWEGSYQNAPVTITFGYRLVVPDSPTLDFISNSVENATIDFWLQDTDTNYGVVMAHHEDLSKHWSLRKLHGSNFAFRTSWASPLINSNLPIDREWHHHALVKEGDRYSIYSDGVLQDSAIHTGEMLPNAPLGICDHYYKYSPTKQKLANIRFSKEALWTEDFEINGDTLFYNDDPTFASSIYHIGHRGNLRGKAAAGYVRPTINQFFTSSDYEEIVSTFDMLPETTGFLDSLYVYDGDTSTKTSVNLIPRGKWYFEQKVLLRDDNGANRVSFLDESGTLQAHATGSMNGITYEASFACHTGTVMGIRLDVDAGTIDIYKNNSYVTSKSWEPGTAIRLRATSWANGGSNRMNCQVNVGPNLRYTVPEGYSPLPYEFNL